MNAPFKMPGLDRDHYLKLDLTRSGEGEGFELIVSRLLEEVRALPGSTKGNKSKQEGALRVVAANLVHIGRLSPTMPLTYSRGNCNNKITRYNAYRVSSKHLRWVVDGLEELGYLNSKIGEYGLTSTPIRERTDKDKGNLSRVWATPKMVNLVDQHEGLGIHIHKRAKELIVLKGPRKKVGKKPKKGPNGQIKKRSKPKAKLVDYQDTDFTHKSRAILKNHNALLARTEITLAGHTGELILRVGDKSYDLTDKTCYRSFSNSSFEQGGRVYGGWWEVIPNNDKDGVVRGYRKKILIDGNATVELDFSSLHLTMAYSLERIDPLAVSTQADLYELPGYERSVVKTAWNVSLSCHKRDSGLGAIQEELEEMGIEKTTEELSHLVDAFQAKHPKVAKYMFRNWGLKLQFQDSEMMMIIIQRFDELGIPVLTVHDSIIVEEKHEELGKRIMHESYNEAGFIGTPLIRKE
jgi:hypothetical protein